MGTRVLTHCHIYVYRLSGGPTYPDSAARHLGQLQRCLFEVLLLTLEEPARKITNEWENHGNLPWKTHRKYWALGKPWEKQGKMEV